MVQILPVILLSVIEIIVFRHMLVFDVKVMKRMRLEILQMVQILNVIVR